MTQFTYRAFIVTGDLVEGKIEAASREEAMKILLQTGVTPFEWKKTAPISLSLFRRANRPTSARISAFTREFAILEEAKIPLEKSLRLLTAPGAHPSTRQIAEQLLQKIIDGSSLSQALAAQPDIFGEDYVQIVQEGESVGRVGPALVELAEMLERRQELRRRIQSALVYPALLIVMAAASTSIVLGTLIPNIAPIFADNGKPMPSGLKFILDAQSHSLAVLLSLAVFCTVIFMGLRFIAARPPLQIAMDLTLLKLPIAGPLLQKLAVARFARSLGSMLKAGAPMLHSLESARTSVANHYLRDRFTDVIEHVRAGDRLSTTLLDIDYFPPAAAQMIAIGEETGQTPDMLLRLAVQFERDSQTMIERAMNLLTPVLTIMIAGVVGGLIFTVMDAVLGINDIAGK